MKICLINAGFDTTLVSPEQLLARYFHVPKLAVALAGCEHQVTVLQACHRDDGRQLDGVEYDFIAAGRNGENPWAEIEQAERVTSRLEARQPDVVHLFGVTMLSLRGALGNWCAQRDVVFTASFHGGSPNRMPLARWRQRRAFGNVSAVFFSAAEYAGRWRRSGVLGNDTRIEIAAEVSSPFQGKARSEARAALDVSGHPVFAWSGRLHPVKDPMTALEGFERVLQYWPQADFLMAYQTAELLPEIEAFLHDRPLLREKVRLLGSLPHEHMELLFSAADFFVATSLREYGGNSLVESMSCGAIPLLSDIPSFRALTKRVPSAYRFATRDASGLANAVTSAMQQELRDLSASVKADFEQHLSYRALAKRYTDVFQSL